MTEHIPDGQAICRIDDIPVPGARRVARPRGLEVAPFRNPGGGIFALLDHCPHRGDPLSQGIVFGTRVACPLHHWTIDLCDGQAHAPDQGCMAKFAVEADNGTVCRDRYELATLATDQARRRAGKVGTAGGRSAMPMPMGRYIIFQGDKNDFSGDPDLCRTCPPSSVFQVSWRRSPLAAPANRQSRTSGLARWRDRDLGGCRPDIAGRNAFGAWLLWRHLRAGFRVSPFSFFPT